MPLLFSLLQVMKNNDNDDEKEVEYVSIVIYLILRRGTWKFKESMELTLAILA